MNAPRFLLSFAPGLLLVVAGCGLPPGVRYRCEADLSCARTGDVCGADLYCHPPEDFAPDGGGDDAGAMDGGDVDAGETDAGATDAGSTDGGSKPDAGSTDGGSKPDAGGADAGLCGNVACFHFEEGDGGTTADATGQNPGTLVNKPAWTTGRVGSGLLFDGSTTRIDLGSGASLRITGSLSIVAWIRPTGLPAGNDDAAIVSKMQSAIRGFQLDTTIDKGPRTIGFKLQDPAGALMMRYGQTAVTQDAWHHVAGVYDAPARKMEVYLDGVNDNGPLDGTITTSQLDVSSGVTIGSRAGAPGTYNFKGVIDEVMIFDRPLTVEEINALYRAAP